MNSWVSLLLVTLFTLVELNCENLFDTQHDEGKNDVEWTPTGKNRWTPPRYWTKLNRTAQTIMACATVKKPVVLPDLVALTEVENDSVLRDLTQRSLLRRANYRYVMTQSPDLRGIDVALLYSPFTFRLVGQRSLRIAHQPKERPTRDVLWVWGDTKGEQRLHVLVVHAPSRTGGERVTRPYRLRVAQRVAQAVDSIAKHEPKSRIIVVGDFNDYTNDPALQRLQSAGLVDVSANAQGSHGAKGTYRYQGRWGSLDHILCDKKTAAQLTLCCVADFPFLLEEEPRYGGVRPRRNYLGPVYKNGFSDHLPIVATWEW